MMKEANHHPHQYYRPRRIQTIVRVVAADSEDEPRRAAVLGVAPKMVREVVLLAEEKGGSNHRARLLAAAVILV